jgi:hypothetical protein
MAFGAERACLGEIRGARDSAKFVATENPSREASLVKTKLQEAEFWAEEDLRVKREGPGDPHG